MEQAVAEPRCSTPVDRGSEHDASYSLAVAALGTGEKKEVVLKAVTVHSGPLMAASDTMHSPCKIMSVPLSGYATSVVPA